MATSPLCDPTELKARIDAGTAPTMIDVREAAELAICRIPGALHVPMGDIPSRLTELEKYADGELVVICHHGVRSGNVQAYLVRHGFEAVRNLVGGIDAYSVVADPTIPRY